MCPATGYGFKKKDLKPQRFGLYTSQYGTSKCSLNLPTFTGALSKGSARSPLHSPQCSGQAHQRTHHLARPKSWLNMIGLMLVMSGRVAEASVSLFYSSSWLTDNDAFQRGVSQFEAITAHFPSVPFQNSIDPSLQQAIAAAVTSAVTVAVADLQSKHKGDIQSLRSMLEKVLPRSRDTSPPTT